MEIERKFLLENSDILKFLYKNKITIYKSNILQFYVEVSKTNEIRYRKKDEIYYLTTKSGVGLERDEFEVVVAKAEFRDAFNKKLSSLIKKERYSFTIDSLVYYVDIYKGSLSGLYILEIEFDSRDSANSFNFSEALSEFIVKEITQDERYKNKNLALFGNPAYDFDLEKTLNLIDKSPNLTLNFPSYIDAYHGMRLLLNQIYINIKKHKDSYIKTKNPEDLHQLRVNLRKTRSLLKSASELYSDEILGEILNSLKKIAKSTNQRRDFDVFTEYLEGVDGSDEVIKSLEFVSNNQSSNVNSALNSDEYMLFAMDYEGFLSDKDGFYRVKECHMKPFVAKMIRSEIVKVEKRVASLSAEVANDEFHSTRVELKRLRYLLESFANMFDVRAIKELFKRLKFMQELFGKLQDRDVWCDIIDMYDKGEVGEFLNRQKSQIWVEMFELRGEILDSRVKFLRQTKKVSRVLKAYY